MEDIKTESNTPLVDAILAKDIKVVDTTIKNILHTQYTTATTVK